MINPDENMFINEHTNDEIIQYGNDIYNSIIHFMVENERNEAFQQKWFYKFFHQFLYEKLFIGFLASVVAVGTDISIKINKKVGFKGNINDSIDVSKYENSIGSTPIKTDKRIIDGSLMITNYYEDGLSSTMEFKPLFSPLMNEVARYVDQQKEEYEKVCVARRLGFDEETILSKDWEEIYDLVYNHARANNLVKGKKTLVHIKPFSKNW